MCEVGYIDVIKSELNVPQIIEHWKVDFYAKLVIVIRLVLRYVLRQSKIMSTQ